MNEGHSALLALEGCHEYVNLCATGQRTICLRRQGVTAQPAARLSIRRQRETLGPTAL